MCYVPPDDVILAYGPGIQEVIQIIVVVVFPQELKGKQRTMLMQLHLLVYSWKRWNDVVSTIKNS